MPSIYYRGDNRVISEIQKPGSSRALSRAAGELQPRLLPIFSSLLSPTVLKTLWILAVTS